MGQIEIHVSEAWAERLKAQPLQGVTDGYPVIADEGLSDGDVRLVIDDAQVEDLMSERLDQLAQQLDATDFTNSAAVAESEPVPAPASAEPMLSESSAADAHTEPRPTDPLDADSDALSAADGEPNEE